MSSDKALSGNKSLTIIVILSLFFSLQVPALCLGSESVKEQNKSNSKEKEEPFFKEWMKEELTIWTSPARIRKKNILFIAGLSLTTAFIIKNDEYIIREIKDFTAAHSWIKNSGSMITFLGSAPYDLVMIGGIYLGGLLFKDNRAKETAALSLKALLHSILVSQVFKLLLRRQRPDYNNGVDQWFNSGIGKAFRSFPSGHTAQVWSLATVVSGMYKDKPAIPVICYSLAVLAGLSRITENEHWASDVLVGAVIGYSIGRFIINKRNNRFMVSPMINGQKTGLNLSFVF